MENKEQQILSEIRSMMASLRSQLDLLDAKMAEFQQTVGAEASDSAPIDLDIEADVISFEDDLPFDDLPEFAEPESEPEPEPEPEQAAEPEQATAPEPEPVPEPVPEPEPVLLMEPEDLPAAAPVTSVEPEPMVKTAVIDTMVDLQPWRTDMPGSAVKDIRSAISLNDRIIFINYLFREDPMLFQETLNRINQMTSFDEVVNLAVSEFPDWDLGSEVVYRFMMAVRRRIR